MNTNTPLSTSMNNSSIIGIGTDILEIKRFEWAMEKYGQKFIERIFTPDEIKHCLKYSKPSPRFAVRFCAKEAVAKSLGVGFGKHLAFHDIEISSEPSGKPLVLLSFKSQEHFNHPKFHLSMSHCHFYATANAIALAG